LFSSRATHYRKQHLCRVSKIPGEGLKTPGEDFAVYNTRRRRHGKDLAGEESSPGVFFSNTRQRAFAGCQMQTHSGEKPNSVFVLSNCPFTSPCVFFLVHGKEWKRATSSLFLHRVLWRGAHGETDFAVCQFQYTANQLNQIF
jgi:hypothetical protein